MVEGIDVSVHNGDINWNEVARSNVDFAFIKATEGMTIEDARLTRGRVRAADQTLGRSLVGYYHFAHPENNRARDECGHFVETVEAVGGRLGRNGVLDYEIAHPGNDDDAWIAAWVDEYRKRTGERPIIYGGNVLRENTSENFACPLWLAAYVSNPDPYVPQAWKRGDYRLRVWQYTDTGRCPGVTGNVDRNKFFGNHAELRHFMG